MADAPKILATDKLNQAFPKLNQGIENSNEALKKSTRAESKSDNAVATSHTAKQTAASTRTELNAVVGRATDSDAMSRQAAVNAKGEDKENLKARLDEDYNIFSSKLTENAKVIELIGNANAESPLYIPCYDGSIQAIHPKVLYFPNKFNGYSYWMAYTPYPNGSIYYENPSIAVSQDGVLWSTPPGLINPVTPKPDGSSSLVYLSDTHLVYRDSALEIWYRFADENSKVTKICRKTSTDGITWGNEEVLLIGGFGGADDHLSPSVIYEDNKYKMWSVGGGFVNYRESTDGYSWSNKIALNIDFNSLGYRPWHIDVIHTDKGYEFVVQSIRNDGGTNNNSDLLYVSSFDNVVFDKPIKILSPSNEKAKWDSQGIYRASIVKVNEEYYIYYSAVSPDSKRGTGLTIGTEVTNLKGNTMKNYSGYVVNKLLMDYGAFFQWNALGLGTDAGWRAVLRFDTKTRMKFVEKFSDNTPLDFLVNTLVANGISFKDSYALIRPDQMKQYILQGNTSYSYSLVPSTQGKGTAKIINENDATQRRDGGLELGMLYLTSSTDSMSGGLGAREGAIRYNSETKKHQGYDGNVWNNLY